MTVLVEIARSVARMVVMLAWHFLLPGFVAVAVLVEIAGRVAGVVVVLTRRFFWHICPPWVSKTDRSPSTTAAALLSFSCGAVFKSRPAELRQGFYNLMSLEDQGE